MHKQHAYPGLLPEPAQTPQVDAGAAAAIKAQQRAEKRRARKLRIRLLAWAIPAMLLVLLLAFKFIHAGFAARQVASDYAQSRFEDALNTASTQKIANFYETWKAHHNLGTAQLRMRLLPEAEREFLTGLRGADADGKCHILPNLAITYEQLGDIARANGVEADAKKRYQQAIDAVKQMPPEKCKPPEQSSAQQTKQRAEQKLQGNEQPKQQPSQDQPPQQPQQPQQPEPKEVKDLREQLEQNNEKRDKSNGGGVSDGGPGSGSNNTPKPW